MKTTETVELRVEHGAIWGIDVLTKYDPPKIAEFSGKRTTSTASGMAISEGAAHKLYLELDKQFGPKVIHTHDTRNIARILWSSDNWKGSQRQADIATLYILKTLLGLRAMMDGQVNVDLGEVGTLMIRHAPVAKGSA